MFRFWRSWRSYRTHITNKVQPGRFAGEDKIYTFDEYIKELDKCSKNNIPGKFDSAEDALKCLVAKETERARGHRTEAAGETQEVDSITDMQVNMLVSETVQIPFGGSGRKR